MITQFFSDNAANFVLGPAIKFYRVRKGDHVGPVNCTADCNPPCQFYWSTPLGDVTGSVLDFNITNLFQNGTYHCHAFNENDDWKSESVNVLCKYY